MNENKKYVLVLFLICFLAGVMLSFVYSLTQARIEERKKEEFDTVIREFFPQAKKIEEIKKEDFNYYQANDEGENILGYIFICEAKGYSSTIKAVVATEPDGKIKEIKILEQNETPGIGTRITEDEFLNRFKGKKKEDSIDTISGATVSSSSLIKAIKENLNKIFQ
jgi:electron transport complex protein RnfG